MDFDKLKKMAKEDAEIDGTELDIESMKLPQLHNKYLNLLQDEKLILRKLISDKNTLYRLKWEYYTGKLDKETLDKHGWEQFQLNVLKKDINIYLDSDPDLSIMRDRVAYHEVILSFLEETLKELNTRHWKLKNAIDWRKFTSGGF
tara:strand:+ start:159 stop:596 length:438 start_codon:yes stop_codon:yes gene_type:complete